MTDFILKMHATGLPSTSNPEQDLTSIKPIAFYLPQFHRIPENDQWWGEGFTEWTNVKKAHPLFRGHHQPHIPCDSLGYYDLTDTTIFKKQIRMAKENGIFGFCFYHYWFKGKKLLEQPIESFLKNRSLNMNFCLSWANEPWTRRWDGQEKEILQSQTYGDKKDWICHFSYLSQFFRDDRYIRIDGKPVVLIYRSGHIDVFDEMISCWRDQAKNEGFSDVYVVTTLNGFKDSYSNLPTKNINAVCEFAPMVAEVSPKFFEKKFQQIRWRLGRKNMYSYDRSWKKILKRSPIFPVQFRGAFVAWDNTARRGKEAFIWRGSTPQKFKKYVRIQMENIVRELPKDRRFLFVNAWNEWAEGCHLEPDRRFGMGYLEAIKDLVLPRNQK